jgi:hypothetical protein
VSWADHTAAAAAEAPANKKSRLDWMVLVGFGAAIVVIIGAVVAAVILAMRMDLGEPTVSAQTTSAEASAPTATLETPVIETTVVEDTGAEETQAAGPGEEVRDGNFAFVVGDVHSVEAVAHPDDPAVQKDAQGEFVIVEMTVTNVSAEPQPFYVSFSTLSDGSTVYKSDDEAWLYLGHAVADLSPGASLETSVVFDVPVGTRVESIELHDSPSSKGVTVGL